MLSAARGFLGPYLVAHHFCQVGLHARSLAQAAQEEGGVEAVTAAPDRREPAAPAAQSPDVWRAVQVLAQLEEVARVTAHARAPFAQAGRRRQRQTGLPRSGRRAPGSQQQHPSLLEGLADGADAQRYIIRQRPGAGVVVDQSRKRGLRRRRRAQAETRRRVPRREESQPVGRAVGGVQHPAREDVRARQEALVLGALE